jgi:hypothetical protein
VVTDTTKAETDMGLKRLHKLHRAAMKAALGIQIRDHPEDAVTAANTTGFSTRDGLESNGWVSLEMCT